ncbi:MAG: hypothetical protein JWM41_1781 [Gemmatimonadetes bacterium]|nr:hypothetical protein [Gemmatimonadota bacterium]
MRTVLPMLLVLAVSHPHCSGGADAVVAPKSVDATDLQLTPSEAPADGATLVTAKVTVTTDSGHAPVNVSLASTTGIFPSAASSTFTGITDGSHTVVATLKVGRDTGVFLLRASAGAASQTKSIHLTYAYPQQLVLTGAALTVGAKATITINVSAIRAPGFVTRGALISFVLQRADSVDKPAPGSVEGPAVTDSLGNAVVHFTSGAATAADSVVLVAATPSADAAKPVVGRIKLYITP